MGLTYPSIEINLGGGQFVTFTRDQIINASVVEEINAAGVELPISTLEFTVDDADGSLNMFDGETYEKLKEKLPITVREFFNGEFVLIGVFYLDTWENKTDTKIEFTAVNIIGVLADEDFDGIFWDEAVTLTEAMSQVFASLGTIYNIDSEIASNTISGWIAPSTYRDALQQICFAGGAVPITARRNNLLLAPYEIPSAYRDYIATRANAKQNGIEVLPQVARIEIVSHNYTESGELETIFEKTLPAGEHKIVFDQPYYGITVDGAGYVEKVLGTEGGDYITTEDEDYLEGGGQFTFGSNSVYIYLDEEALITITGYRWLDSKRSYIFTESGVVASSKKKNYLISDATLVNTDRAESVLERLTDYYRLRYVQDVTLLPNIQKTGDIILSDAINQERIIATLQKSVISLSGGFLSKVNLVGKLPDYILPVENPTRYARTGIATAGTVLTYNNQWRQYA